MDVGTATERVDMTSVQRQRDSTHDVTRSPWTCSNHFPDVHDHQVGISLSISQEDRSLEPVVPSLGRMKAWRCSEVVLAGGNGLAGGDTVQHILCAVPDSRIAHLDP